VSRLFISHASADNAAAAALHVWLREQGFDDVFLDIDAERGFVPGERWQEALKAATNRCEAVLCLVSTAWLASKWCHAEFLAAKLLHKRIFGLIVEPVPEEQLPADMKAEWQLCELTGEDRFRSFEVEVLGRAAQVAFREAGLDLLRRGLQRAGLDARSFPWPPSREPDRAPYRGLKALEPQDAAVFFGRDAWIVRGLDRIRGLVEEGVAHLLVILGASGSGKSSFLRAGLWPRLERDDAEFLPLPVIRPQSAVIGGSSGLAASLAGAFERLGAPRAVGHIKDTLTAEGRFAGLLGGLTDLARRRLAVIDAEAAAPVILLPLDQAEELFNPEGTVEAALFLDLLAAALGPGEHKTRLLVIATMRSDRYEQLQAETRFLGIEQALFNLPPLSPAEFRGVIEGPVRRVAEAGGRLQIEPALTERLIADADGGDALPLLGFTLERLYADYGAAGRLTLDDYQRLGGVQGSIEAAVARALAEPGRMPAIPYDREAQYTALRAAVIPWLAQIDPESGTPMRRLARREEIPDASHAFVERLIDARLLVADRRDSADVVEIAHESLLRQWPALTAWLDTDAADLIVVEGIERAAAEWARNDRSEAWLDHRGERLATANALATREDFGRRLGADELSYLSACRAREETELHEREAALTREQARLTEIAIAQARTSRLQRIVGAALAVVILLVAVGGGIVWWQRKTNLHQAVALAEQRVVLLADLAEAERAGGRSAGGLRLAAYSAERASDIDPHARSAAEARGQLARSASHAQWRLMLAGHLGVVSSAAYSPDGSRIVTASDDKTARVWDARVATRATDELLAEVCIHQLRGLSVLTRAEMRLIGEPDDRPQIDVCAGIAQ
jgi:TIR domain